MTLSKNIKKKYKDIKTNLKDLTGEMKSTCMFFRGVKVKFSLICMMVHQKYYLLSQSTDEDGQVLQGINNTLYLELLRKKMQI